MNENDPRESDPRQQSAAAVGIVVNDGGPVAARPRAIAFVWGQRVRSAPSLPYGRWKKNRPSAA